jgi:hypothetical protein
VPNARTTDPLTSHEAASSAWNPTIVQQHILDILEHDAEVTDNSAGMTDDDLYRAYVAESRQHGWVMPTPQSVRSRRSELTRRGLIEFTGLYGMTDSGRRTQQWRKVTGA